MRKFSVAIAGAAIMMLASTAAHADIVPYGPNEGFYYEASPIGDPPDELGWVEDITGADLTYLNKFDYGDDFDNTGAVDGSYFDEGGSTQGTSKTISWDLTGSGFGVNYVLIKDGSTGGPDGQQIYRLYSVTDEQFLVGGGVIDFAGTGANDWDNKGISHVAWFGSVASVPDGGVTLSLLGSALVGLGLLRRKLGA